MKTRVEDLKKQLKELWVRRSVIEERLKELGGMQLVEPMKETQPISQEQMEERRQLVSEYDSLKEKEKEITSEIRLWSNI